MRHLTDDEIQAYLDGTGPDLSETMESHISSCKRCRRSIETYRMLYIGLADAGSFEPVRDPAPAVLCMLGIETSRGRSRPIEVILAAVGIVAAVAVALAWLDLGPLAGAIADLAGPLTGILSHAVEIARSYFGDLNHGVTTLLLGAAVLLSMVALDMFLPRKHLAASGRRRM